MDDYQFICLMVKTVLTMTLITCPSKCPLYLLYALWVSRITFIEISRFFILFKSFPQFESPFEMLISIVPLFLLFINTILTSLEHLNIFSNLVYIHNFGTPKKKTQKSPKTRQLKYETGSRRNTRHLNPFTTQHRNIKAKQNKSYLERTGCNHSCSKRVNRSWSTYATRRVAQSTNRL